MAYTKIHAIKATVDKAIDYICNPDKTDEQIYVSSFACAARNSRRLTLVSTLATIAERTVLTKPII